MTQHTHSPRACITCHQVFDIGAPDAPFDAPIVYDICPRCLPLHRVATVKIVCAWCNAPMGGDLASEHVSHGCCPTCERMLLEESERKFAESHAEPVDHTDELSLLKADRGR